MLKGRASRIRTAQKLMDRFGRTAKHITVVQNGVYKVVTQNGKTYSLKRMPCSVRQLRWIDATLRGIRRSGFPALAWNSESKKTGSSVYAKLTSSAFPYVLTPWLRGRWPHVRSSRDMRACGAALAKFHASARRSKPKMLASVNMLGTWPAKMRRDQRMIGDCVKAAKRNEFGRRMDDLLATYGDEIIAYCKEARRLLRKSDYRRKCRASGLKRTVCHGDGGPSNFILNKKGTHLIDFETLRIDLRAYDLYRVIYNSCKDHQWDFRIAQRLLDGYQSVARLNRTDIALLQALLRFPRSVHLIVRQFRKNRKRDKEEAERALKAAVRAERAVTKFLRKLDGYI